MWYNFFMRAKHIIIYLEELKTFLLRGPRLFWPRKWSRTSGSEGPFWAQKVFPNSSQNFQTARKMSKQHAKKIHYDKTHKSIKCLMYVAGTYKLLKILRVGNSCWPNLPGIKFAKMSHYLQVLNLFINLQTFLG